MNAKHSKGLLIVLLITSLVINIALTAVISQQLSAVNTVTSIDEFNHLKTNPETSSEIYPSTTQGESSKDNRNGLLFSENAIQASKTALTHPMMVNSEPPNGIVVHNNQLVMSDKLKGLFDYFLLLQNIEDIETIEYLLHSHAEQVLGQNQHKDALLIKLNHTFNQYHEFLNTPITTSFSQIESHDIDLDSITILSSIHEEIKEHRRTHLGTELANAFYGKSEDYSTQQITNAKTFMEHNKLPENFNSMAFKHINEDLVFYNENHFTAEMRYEDRKEKYGSEVAERWLKYEASLNR